MALGGAQTKIKWKLASVSQTMSQNIAFTHVYTKKPLHQQALAPRPFILQASLGPPEPGPDKPLSNNQKLNGDFPGPPFVMP